VALDLFRGDLFLRWISGVARVSVSELVVGRQSVIFSCKLEWTLEKGFLREFSPILPNIGL